RPVRAGRCRRHPPPRESAAAEHPAPSRARGCTGRPVRRWARQAADQFAAGGLMRIPHYAQIYRARDGWRWRLVAGNGKIVADSGEAYASTRNARRAFVAVIEATRPEALLAARDRAAILLARGDDR